VKFLVALLLISSFQAVHAQADDAVFEKRAREGIDLVYNLEFHRADSVFRELIKEKPRHPAGRFFMAMVDWWRIMLDMDDTQYDERFLDSLDAVIELCDELLDENEADVTALFFKGGALGFSGRLQFHRDDWFAAANAGRKALPLVNGAFAADSTNYDIYLGTGIYNYYAEVIPERYPVAKPLLLFIPPGDKATGIRQLRIAAEKGKYAHVEATYFLMQLNYLYEKNYPEALKLAVGLHQRYPNNMLFHRYVGRCFISLANYQQARSVFADIERRVRLDHPGYNVKVGREAEYYLGLCEFHTRNYQRATDHFLASDRMSRSLDTEGPSPFMILANLYLGKIYDAQTRRDLAVRQYEKVLDMDEYLDSHKQAETYLRTPFSH
jgi:tetratricopeptide (TPR) repeat protein